MAPLKLLAWTCLFGGLGLIAWALVLDPGKPLSRPEDDHFFLVSRSESARESDALTRYQCARCHLLPERAKLPQEESCVSCHQGIFRGDYDTRFSKAAIERWKSHIHHLMAVPSLVNVSSHLKREWVESYLRSPNVVRPHLGAMMPRLKLGDEEIREILEVLYKNAPREKESAVTLSDNSARGETLYRERGCQSCHEFSGVLPRSGGLEGESFRNLPINIRLAPDLRFVRERMTKEAFAKWLRNESGSRDEALMPKFTLADEEIDSLYAFLIGEQLGPQQNNEDFAVLPFLSRDVFYLEIEEKITKKVCWHCHAKVIPRTGDGGPGNTGGFGYEGAGLDLGSYEGILRGSTRREPEQRNILEKNEKGIPKVIAHLLARHSELQGKNEEQYLGMPLGLPPLSAEEIQLLWSWIEQGARYNR